MPGLIGCGVDVRAKDGDGKEHHTTGVICAIFPPRGKERVELFLMNPSGDFFRAESGSCHVDKKDIWSVYTRRV